MKTLMVYDSYFGNTKKIAKAISEELKKPTVKNIKDFKPEYLKNTDILIVGSPTRAFNFSDKTKEFMDKIPQDELKGKKVATFDTRIDHKEVKPRILGFLMKIFGYADKKIMKILLNKGGEKLTEPEGFIVLGKEGPLKDGEIERAKKWAVQLSNNANLPQQ